MSSPSAWLNVEWLIRAATLLTLPGFPASFPLLGLAHLETMPSNTLVTEGAMQTGIGPGNQPVAQNRKGKLLDVVRRNERPSLEWRRRPESCGKMRGCRAGLRPGPSAFSSRVASTRSRR